MLPKTKSVFKKKIMKSFSFVIILILLNGAVGQHDSDKINDIGNDWRGKYN